MVTLGIWIAEEPAIILPYLNAVFYEIVITQFPGYEQIHPETFIRVIFK